MNSSVFRQNKLDEMTLRCDAWRQLCYKHERTIIELKYDLVCAKAGLDECVKFMESVNGMNSHPQWLELQELIKKYTGG